MVSIKDVHAQLATAKRFGPDLVGVFVGGTSGIGEGTARAFVRYATSPRVYIVGRSQDQADALIKQFAELNKQAKISFIKSDVSLLQNVDQVCEEIKSKEDRVNLLCLTAGFLSMKGRDETTEGLDKKLSLHYYSRLRFVQNLLPLLQNAASSAPAEGSRPLATIVSALGGGLEGTLNTSDLQLKTSYSISNAAQHAITMTTLQFRNLAEKNQGIGFIHTQPGGVQTNIARGLGGFAAKATNAAGFLLKPWMHSGEESGERHMYAATEDKYAKGLHIVGSNSTETDNSKLLKKMSDDGVEQKVWGHTNEVFGKIAASGKYP